MTQSTFRMRAPAALLLLFLLPPAVEAQTGAPIGNAAFDSAFYAWERGDYIEALRRAEALLDGPDPHRYLEPLALLTGELYATMELTPDGLDPRWAPDSRHVTWQTGTGAEAVTHVALVDEGSMRTIATVEGRDVQLDAMGNAIYVQGPEHAARVVKRALHTGREQTLDTGSLQVQSILVDGNGDVHALLGDDENTHLYAVGDGSPRRLTDVPGPKSDPVWLADGRLLYMIDRQNFGLLDLTGAGGRSREASVRGSQAAASADGSTIAFIAAGSDGFEILVQRGAADAQVVVRSDHAVASPALSPDGRRLAWQAMPRENWDIHVLDLDGAGSPMRITHDVQHDLMPQFIDGERLLAVMGEGRHRRSFLHELGPVAGRTRLFDGNSVRTVAPEYEWLLSPDRTKVLIVAERDGDTVSPERGVYILDLSRRVTVQELRSRVRRQLAGEMRLRERGRELFAGLEERVQQAIDDVSKDRIYRYSHDLHQFGSKYITQPGNARAIEYLVMKLREFGYEPELQWFEPQPRGSQQRVRTANVIARLPGTVHPDVLYTVSSHFDSVERGPGADDNSSGTAALLEAARVLAGRPQPATIHFAFFTGEEAGLLGSREYVRRAVAADDRLVGALNNDMIGYANDQRLDNTIRYSNAGIRDIQHAAAFLFTDLITYDAKYYKSTDAHAFYEAYGDIVGGIGSYPILGNPHYHQTHDVLETINHQLVAEVSKATVATLVQLGSSASRPRLLESSSEGGERNVSWEPLPERDLTGYRVRVIGPDGGVRHSLDLPADATAARVPAGPQDIVEIWGLNRRGPGWDAARVTGG